MMLERGVEVSHEAIRLWTLKFGAQYACRLRRDRGRCGDRWHLDEVFLKINGEQVYLWRAVDQEGEVLDILVQKRLWCAKTRATRFQLETARRYGMIAAWHSSRLVFCDFSARFYNC
jgi:putative transposase